MSTALSALFVAGPGLGGTVSPLLADKWDPRTKDYASLDEGMDPVDAHVIHELCVLRGSGASVRDVGLDRLPTKMLDSLEQEVASAVRFALARLLTNGDIRLNSVKLANRDDANQMSDVVISYVNLRTGQNSTAVLPGATGQA